MKRVLLFVLCLFLVLVSPVRSQQDAKAIYKDPNAAIPARVHDLLTKMTVEEKVAQLESGWNLPGFGSFKSPVIFEQDHLNDAMVKQMAGNGLGTYVFLDEFLGTSGPANPALGAQHRNLLQSWVIKNTRLGIPILFHGEALHGAVLPGATSFAATWGWEAHGIPSYWKCCNGCARNARRWKRSGPRAGSRRAATCYGRAGRCIRGSLSVRRWELLLSEVCKDRQNDYGENHVFAPPSMASTDSQRMARTSAPVICLSAPCGASFSIHSNKRQERAHRSGHALL